MSASIPYVPTEDFSQDEADDIAGRATVLTPELDTEFANIKRAIDSLIARSSAIQRDDNELKDAQVEPFNLSSATVLLIGSGAFTFSANGATWSTGIAYAVQNLVQSGTGTYVCVTAHTSGVFATDYAAGKWLKLFDAVIYLASSISFIPSGGIISSDVQSALVELDAKKLAKASNLSDVGSFATSRTNLGVWSKTENLQLFGARASAGGSADALTGAFTPAVTSLATPFLVYVKATAANLTGTPTFTADATSTKIIAKFNGGALLAGDITGPSHILMLYWDPATDKYLLLNPSVVTAAPTVFVDNATKLYTQRYYGGLF